MKKNFWPLFKKEISTNYLISPLGFVFASLLFLIANWLFFQDFFLASQASLRPLFAILPFLLLFFLPAITMNLFSEEKKNKTWEILLTLPINEKKIVLAKFFASLGFTALTIFLTLPLAVVAGILGRPDWGIIISSYLGVVFLAACYLSTGVFFSSLTNNSIIAFLTSLVFLLINFFLGQENILNRLPDFLIRIFSFLSLNFHYSSFNQGQIPASSLIFYLSWIFLFLWLTIVALKSRDY